MNTTTNTIPYQQQRRLDRARAVAALRELAPAGHALSYLAKALTLRGIPTLSGRPGAPWVGSAVHALAKAEGITLGSRFKRA